MPTQCSSSEFSALLLSSLGVYMLVLIIVRYVAKPICKFFDYHRDTLREDEVLRSLRQAYEENNSRKIDKANINFVYKKFENLNTNRSIRQKLSDLRSAKKANPPNYLRVIRLLSKALPNQRDPTLRYEISAYMVLLDDAIHRREIAVSIWLTELLLMTYFRYTQTLDTLTQNELIVIFSLLIIFMSIPILAIKKTFKLSTLITSFLISFYVVAAFLWGYSFIIHTGTMPSSDPTSGISLDCPKWLSLGNPKACEGIFYIRSNGNTPVSLKIQYDENSFYVKDNECNNVISSEQSVSPVGPFAFALVPKDTKVLEDQSVSQLRIYKVVGNGTLEALDHLSCNVNIEHPIWEYIRLALGGATAVLTVIFAIMKSSDLASRHRSDQQ